MTNLNEHSPNSTRSGPGNKGENQQLPGRGNRMRLNWRRGLFRSLLAVVVAWVGYAAFHEDATKYLDFDLRVASNRAEGDCWTRIAKWPDGQPFNVFDLFEEANTPSNVELNRRRGAWSADSIPVRNQWVVSTKQKLIACETGGPVASQMTGQVTNVWLSLRNSLAGLFLPPLALLIMGWVIRGFRPSKA